MQQINNPYSDLKILCHTDKLDDILKQKRTAPLHVRIKPTNICNQNCWYCLYANDAVVKNRSVNRRESIPWKKMKEIVNDLSDIGTKAVTFSGGGEPLCYSHICETIELVQQKGIEYAVISNGQALNEKERDALSRARWVRISLDSVNEQMYSKLRGVNTFQTVIRNIERFARKKDDECVLGVNYVVTKDNSGDVYEICSLLSSIGVDNIKFSPLIIKGTVPQYHMDIKDKVEEQISRAQADFQNSRFKIIDKYTNDESLDLNFVKCEKCFISEVFTVIGADCKVYYCHQRAYTSQGMLGDLTDQTFKELWYSDEIIKKSREMKPQDECNFRCAFEERNQLLNQLMNIDKTHINFI